MANRNEELNYGSINGNILQKYWDNNIESMFDETIDDIMRIPDLMQNIIKNPDFLDTMRDELTKQNPKLLETFLNNDKYNKMKQNNKYSQNKDNILSLLKSFKILYFDINVLKNFYKKHKILLCNIGIWMRFMYNNKLFEIQYIQLKNKKDFRIRYHTNFYEKYFIPLCHHNNLLNNVNKTFIYQLSFIIIDYLPRNDEEIPLNIYKPSKFDEFYNSGFNINNDNDIIMKNNDDNTLQLSLNIIKSLTKIDPFTNFALKYGRSIPMSLIKGKTIDVRINETWIKATICAVKNDKILVHIPTLGAQYFDKNSENIAPKWTFVTE